MAVGERDQGSLGKGFSHQMLDRALSINPWHFLWIGIVLSEIFTLAASWLISQILWGRLSYEVLVVGAFDALLVSFLVVSLVIAFVTRISKLQQEIKSRIEAEERVRYLAYYDSLTDLPNRELLKELLKSAISYAQRQKDIMAVLFIDLDNFKHINDTLGHDMGDRLLQAVANRLLTLTRSSDYVARFAENEMTEVASRFGGDEFILMLKKLPSFHDAGKVASRILQEIARPFELNGSEVYITGSIGISMYPYDGENVDDLLKNADVAMYHTKARGRNSYHYYSESMNARALEHMTLANKLHKALKNEEFLLYYQPKQRLRDEKIIGLEALLRWTTEDEGLVLPSKFIPILEETGLIIPVGEWVLRTACLQNRAWQEAGHEPIVISVNLSSRQFDQKNLTEVVTQALRNADLPPELLELEITESSIMRDPDEAITTLYKLKNMGVQISIDDFGTGYSSLSYLRRVPLDSIKIDRSFIMNLGNASDTAIVEAIIALGHSLKVKVVAEGVETTEQLALLRDLGCDEVQGFLLSRPVPAGETPKLLLKEA
jgi:predicted signal transduction protein with EAL and GGDEF domain